MEEQRLKEIVGGVSPTLVPIVLGTQLGVLFSSVNPTEQAFHSSTHALHASKLSGLFWSTLYTHAEMEQLSSLSHAAPGAYAEEEEVEFHFKGFYAHPELGSIPIYFRFCRNLLAEELHDRDQYMIIAYLNETMQAMAEGRSFDSKLVFGVQNEVARNFHIGAEYYYMLGLSELLDLPINQN